MGQRILITGVSRFLGGRLAQRLEQDANVSAIIGVDTEEPSVDLARTEFIRADIRNPLIVKVLQATEVDTVVHAAVIATPGRVGGRANMKEINVIGTMQLYAACQKAESLKRVVMKSSTSIYGSEPGDPGIFTEEMAPRSQPRTGYAKDSVEVENYGRAFGRRRPDVTLTILRFANFIGPLIDTPLTRYFSFPIVPTAMGFDPRLQFLHEDDAIEILYRAATQDHPGTFNASGDGVMYLSQAIRLSGKAPVPVPLPFINLVASGVKRTGAVDFSQDQIRLLLYGRVGDVARLKEEFGYTPRYTSQEAFADFVARRRLAKLFTRDQAVRWEREINDLLRRWPVSR
ncbi:MAG: NAD-dependent epimerase/dehydratase family protein [Actinomycetota bacterium]